MLWQLFGAVLACLLVVSLTLLMRYRKRLAQSLDREEKANQELFDYPTQNPHPVFEVDKKGALIFANAGCEPILSDWKIQIGDRLPIEWRQQMRQASESQNVLQLELMCANQYFALTLVPIANNNVRVFGNDVTEHKRIEQELVEQATIDKNTNLPNRFVFLQNLTLEMKHAQTDNKKLGILIIRLDDYKEIANTYSQAVANQFLLAFSQRYLELGLEGTSIARITDDEFGVIEPLPQTPNAMASVVESIIEHCTKSYQLGNQAFYVTVSIGIAFYPDDGETPESLLQNAQLAVDRTSNTQNQYEFFKRGMVEQLQVKHNIIADLYKALEEEQFTLYYQPQVDLNTLKMTAAEALIRWEHPEKGFVSPYFFMTAAEETHLVLDIGDWVLKTACQQIARWMDAGMPECTISVNVSAKQLFKGDLIGTLKRLLKQTGIPPRLLELEITESVLIHDIDKAIELMKDIHALGIGLALDDFGTGYSSLSYLMRFPVTKLKIDRSFTKTIEDDKHPNAIINGIIGLGHSLELKIVTEGVETKGECEFLKAQRCDLIQGYYFAKPEPAEKFQRFFNLDFPIK